MNDKFLNAYYNIINDIKTGAFDHTILYLSPNIYQLVYYIGLFMYVLKSKDITIEVDTSRTDYEYGFTKKNLLITDKNSFFNYD